MKREGDPVASIANELKRRKKIMRGHRTAYVVVMVCLTGILVAATTVMFHLPGIGFRGEDRGGVIVTLVVDFGPEKAPLHPGNITTWKKLDGEWRYQTNSSGGSVWRFENMSSPGSSVIDCLKMAVKLAGFNIETHEYIYGTFVESIAGVENGRNDHNWLYRVEGEFANIAADRYHLDDGDEIEWRYTDYDIL